MHVKSDTVALVVVATLHLIAQGIHSYSHTIAGVENSLPERLFILFIVTVLPWIAIFVSWRFDVGKGAALFALAMVASFLFGYSLHFVIDGPDLHSRVVEQYRSVFFHSAAGLALLEFSGFVLGLYVLARRMG